MKHFLTILLISICLSGHAQEKHFIFIQSDNGQPFYVSLNGKLFSSSASGYVIIPKLADGEYSFSIGFAQNAFPEQTFRYSINKKDLGFNLKNFGDKGWGLFNLQSLDVTMATAGNTNNVAKALSENAMSKEINEPIISFDRKKEPATAKVDTTKPADALGIEQLAKKDEVIKPEVKKDTAVVSAAVTNIDTVNTPVVADPPTQKETPSLKETTVSDVKKVSEVTAAEGVYLSYSEKNGKNTDTIQVIIPSTQTAADNVNNASKTSSKETDVKTDKEVASGTPLASKRAKDSIKFLDVDPGGIKNDSLPKALKKEETSVKQENVTSGNSNCKNIATDDDFTRLKRKMAMQTSDEKMISEARKVYRSKCFTTTQIKGLSTLFLSDEGRFKFFDASYLSVSDASSYVTLQTEFIDPAYLERFKTMLQ